MDDMWSDDVWDEVKLFFPNDKNGSRIIITTRLSNLASYLTTSGGIKMNFLDEDKSWNLFCKNVFGKDDWPPELEEIGKKIAKNCKGLPLSIVVIGGLLAKSKQTREYWEYMAENLNSIVNLEENERCLKILYMSYDQLPVHLKPCFLYMGTFPEDSKIGVSELIELWVVEGFLKPISGKSLEESAKEYLMDLIDRNLILVSERGSSGKVKFCNIHDLLRDLCLREARKEKFLCSVNQLSLNTPYEGINAERRIAIHLNTSKEEYLDSLESASFTRSLTCYFEGDLPLVKFRLLRVFKRIGEGLRNKEKYSLEAIFRLVNLRYLAIDYFDLNLIFPSSVSLLWNLQTLIVQGSWRGLVLPPEIWKMPLLRHVESNTLRLPDPPSGHTDRRDDFVLQNLHTLMEISNLKFGEEVIKRIPNVKKLGLCYGGGGGMASHYCLNNLGRLYELESISCRLLSRYSWPSRSDLKQNLTFPHSLKELTLVYTWYYWEDMIEKIGSLPLLQVLELKSQSFRGPKWETAEGQFSSLKYLLIEGCYDLEYWTVESYTHFPVLERIVLQGLHKLKEIPLSIGEIPTLQSIEVNNCSDSAVISAERIQGEQEELGNEDLQIRVEVERENYQHLEISSSSNFQVEIFDGPKVVYDKLNRARGHMSAERRGIPAKRRVEEREEFF